MVRVRVVLWCHANNWNMCDALEHTRAAKLRPWRGCGPRARLPSCGPSRGCGPRARRPSSSAASSARRRSVARRSSSAPHAARRRRDAMAAARSLFSGALRASWSNSTRVFARSRGSAPRRRPYGLPDFFSLVAELPQYGAIKNANSTGKYPAGDCMLSSQVRAGAKCSGRPVEPRVPPKLGRKGLRPEHASLPHHACCHGAPTSTCMEYSMSMFLLIAHEYRTAGLPATTSLTHAQFTRTQVKQEAWGVRCWKGKVDPEPTLIRQTEKREWAALPRTHGRAPPDAAPSAAEPTAT